MNIGDYNLFLDDERFPPANSDYAVIARSYEDFKNAVLSHGAPKFVSFDHDLGTTETGLTCARFLIDYYIDHNINPSDLNYTVHSMNPVGAENIRSLINSFKRSYQ